MNSARKINKFYREFNDENTHIHHYEFIISQLVGNTIELTFNIQPKRITTNNMTRGINLNTKISQINRKLSLKRGKFSKYNNYMVIYTHLPGF